MSANVGGYIRGPWWKYLDDDDSKTRRCFVVAWGNIVNEPKESFKDTRAVKFAIKTGRGAGRNEKHLVCVCYGETQCSVVMRAMERGDVVLVCGTWTEKLLSRTKKGIKPTYECRVNYIIPQGLIAFLLNLYATPSITDAVKEHAEAEADPWEGD